MSQSKFWTVNSDNVTITDGAVGLGCGNSHRLYVGNGGSGDRQSYVKFNHDWSGVGRIVSATLVVYTDDQNGAFGPLATTATPRIVARYLASAFATGNNADEVFDASDFTAPHITTSRQASHLMAKAPQAVNRINITGIIGMMAPKTVKQATGEAGLALPNYGLALQVYGGAGTGHRSNRWSGWSQHHTDALLRPQIELVYDEGLTKPNVPTNATPASAIGSLTTFDADFTDTKPADTLFSSEVEVYDGAATNVGQTVTGTRMRQQVQVASNSETTNARSAVVIANLQQTLATGVTYKWRIRQTDQEGQRSDWTNLISFSVTNNNPDPPTVTPLNVTVDTLNGFLFNGDFTDPDGDPLLAYQVQLSNILDLDPNWDDPAFVLWDTGKVFVSSGDTTWQTAYGGQGLQAGVYFWRARNWDARNGVSDWNYAVISLSQDFDGTPGSEPSVQIDPQAPWRILIKAMGTNRGPGEIVAVLENAKAVGASIVYNSPGELHFTLPKDHPQIAVIEPKQVHYALEFYAGDGWREKFAGVVWDNDNADSGGTIFYGVDYLGLFDYVADERYDPSNPNLPPPNGSKYVAKTIKYIINDQLVRAIGLPNSPVGFITVGSIATMNEQVTIWSTMTQVLVFISGLIDSHRQGTGKNTRIQVVKTTTGTYQVQVVDDPGQIKPDMRMRYGELVSGYRVIPFGSNWASLMHGIGRTREGLRVLYKTETVPGIDQTVYGRIAQVQIFEGVTDENDLIRRLKQAAIHAGKLGKQLALGFRSGVVQPLDGYDIPDAIQVDIKDGAVDTSRYGSGYWVVFAVAWEAGDDGSTQTILTILPRDDATAPDPDLIPSVPILSNQSGFQMHDIDPDPAVDADGIWVNSVTGHIFQWDPYTSAWIDLTDTLAGHPRMLGTGVIVDPDFGQPIPGGQNVVLNSGFELGNYGTTADSLATWDVDANWTGSQVRTPTNLNASGNSLVMTTGAY